MPTDLEAQGDNTVLLPFSQFFLFEQLKTAMTSHQKTQEFQKEKSFS